MFLSIADWETLLTFFFRKSWHLHGNFPKTYYIRHQNRNKPYILQILHEGDTSEWKEKDKTSQKRQTTIDSVQMYQRRGVFFLILKTSKQSSTWWNGIFAEFCRPVVLSLLDQASRRRSYVSMYPAQVIGFEEERLRFRTERRRNAIDVRNSGA